MKERNEPQEPLVCPNCGGKNLRRRYLKNGMYTMVCSRCGYVVPGELPPGKDKDVV